MGKITATEIEQIIEAEMLSDQNDTGVTLNNLQKFLVKPIKEEYKYSYDSVEKHLFWTVFEDGYKIYFDEDTREFGLAYISDKYELIDLDGHRGTFCDVLLSM